MRDKKIKEAFIKYLQKETDERFFQALTNFTHFPYIGIASSPKGDNFVDLWNVEGDKEVMWDGKNE